MISACAMVRGQGPRMGSIEYRDLSETCEDQKSKLEQADEEAKVGHPIDHSRAPSARK